jgi:hypothetical protein
MSRRQANGTTCTGLPTERHRASLASIVVLANFGPVDAAGCNGPADQMRIGSLLSFPNGHLWLPILDPNSGGFVATSMQSAWTQPVIHR